MVEKVEDKVPMNPVARMESIAATVDPEKLVEFKPRSIHHQLAGALLNHKPTSIPELAEKAGVEERKLWHILERPEAVAWIVNTSAQLIKVGCAAVYSRCLEMALTSKNPRWAEVFLRRFDPLFKTSEADLSITATNVQVNQFKNYSEAELRAHLKNERKQVLGEAS